MRTPGFGGTTAKAPRVRGARATAFTSTARTSAVAAGHRGTGLSFTSRLRTRPKLAGMGGLALCLTIYATAVSMR